MRCGLIGKKLTHSYSPQIHRLFANYDYDLFELADCAELKDFLTATDCSGLNVTIPYKETVLEFCADLSASARRIGAVNTLSRIGDKKWRGDNTDYYGLIKLFEFHDLKIADKTALVLGGGGAAKTVNAVLQDQRAREIIGVSRTGKINYKNVADLGAAAEIIVNATPVGMYPHNDESPLDLAPFGSLAGVVDLIYNPCRTRLLSAAKARGVSGVNGLMMLIAQAARAVEIWRQEKITPEQIKQAYQKIGFVSRNLVLIGMPGCGKSTLGKKLAAKLNREFFDTDDLIEQRAGKSIPEIFAAEGEQFFRDRESEVITEYAKLSGKIIATGGGAIGRAENRDRLKQNSLTIYLQTPLNELATAGRPLSGDLTRLEKIFADREPLYRELADLIVNRENAIAAVMKLAD